MTYQSLDDFSGIPDLKECLAPYKSIADLNDEKEKHTGKLHKIANAHGYKDWQLFTYKIKTLISELQNVKLSNKEWGYLFDAVNGWAVSLDVTKDELLMQIVDGDRYEALGIKWFNEISTDFEDEHLPSQAMKNFYEKINKLTDTQCVAVVLKALTFWQRVFVA